MMVMNENGHKICSIPEAVRELGICRSRLYILLQKYPDCWQHIGSRAFVDVDQLREKYFKVSADLYPMRKAAEMLGVGMSTLYRHKDEHENAWQMIGGRWYVDVHKILDGMSIDALLAGE